jgi:hypothetical protein
MRITDTLPDSLSDSLPTKLDFSKTFKENILSDLVVKNRSFQIKRW